MQDSSIITVTHLQSINSLKAVPINHPTRPVNEFHDHNHQVCQNHVSGVTTDLLEELYRITAIFCKCCKHIHEIKVEVQVTSKTLQTTGDMIDVMNNQQQQIVSSTLARLTHKL
jgi:hypothetical protein